jgi:hypothetical protein
MKTLHRRHSQSRAAAERFVLALMRS